MVNVDQREFMDIVIEVCTGSQADAEYALIATDGIQLGSIGVLAVVKQAVNSRKLYRTTKELAKDHAGLQTLVLARFSGSDMPTDFWVFDGWSLLRSRGENLNLSGALLRGAPLRGARMKGANLEDADLSGADMEKADLSSTNLTGAKLAGSNLFSANLQTANLTEAELCRCDLRHADLRKAICVRTAFRGADLWNTYMWNVDVSEAFTDGADFKRSDYLNDVIASEPQKR